MKMYQIKYQEGHEIRVIGKGENGLCKVAKATSSNDRELFSGTYDHKWLSDRGIREVGK